MSLKTCSSILTQRQPSVIFHYIVHHCSSPSVSSPLLNLPMQHHSLNVCHF